MDASWLEYCATGEQLKAFNDTGYLIVEDAISTEMVDVLEKVADRIDAEERAKNGLESHKLLSKFRTVIENDILLELLDNKKIFPLLWDILGWNIQLYISHLIMYPLEDKAWDYAMPVFEKYDIPQSWIRKITVPQAELKYKVDKTHFGKKFIGLLDKEIDTDVFLILDSDIFTCTTGEKLNLYDKLTSNLLKNQPAMTYFQLKQLPYAWWVGMVLLASGLPHHLIHKKQLGALEREAYGRLGFEKKETESINSNDKVQRFWAENYMITFPKEHPVRDYTIKNIPTCHTSPYIHAVWAEYNHAFLELSKILELPIYDWEKNFIEGKQGYNCFAHIRVNKGQNSSMSMPSLIHQYWDKFYEHVTRHVLSEEN